MIENGWITNIPRFFFFLWVLSLLDKNANRRKQIGDVMWTLWLHCAVNSPQWLCWPLACETLSWSTFIIPYYDCKSFLGTIKGSSREKTACAILPPLIDCLCGPHSWQPSPLLLHTTKSIVLSSKPTFQIVKKESMVFNCNKHPKYYNINTWTRKFRRSSQTETELRPL